MYKGPESRRVLMTGAPRRVYRSRGRGGGGGGEVRARSKTGGGARGHVTKPSVLRAGEATVCSPSCARSRSRRGPSRLGACSGARLPYLRRGAARRGAPPGSEQQRAAAAVVSRKSCRGDAAARLEGAPSSCASVNRRASLEPYTPRSRRAGVI